MFFPGESKLAFFEEVVLSVPSPPHRLQLASAVKQSQLSLKTAADREKRREGGREGGEPGLIIQIQSLKEKCVFQTVRMINERQQILTNAPV